ncbi:protein kinase [Umbelopsis nana]
MPDDGAANHPMSEAERRALLDGIPEFSTFEAHKENIAQKPQGRRAADLANLFSQSDRDRLAYLEAKRTEFENAIASLEYLDDPLEPYLAYMEVIEACHTQGPSGELVNVLQLATQQFQDDDIYRNDIRYLTCWTKFARLAEDWQAVYKFLSDSDIGQCHARYYEEYAQLHEENRKYEDALATYRLGIAKNARPLARLERRYEEAKQRIQQKREKEVDSSSSSSSRPRAILGEKATSLLGKPNAGIRSPLNDAMDMSAPREKFSVFVQSDASHASPSSSKPSLGHDVYRRKENVLEKSVFKGSILPQKVASKPAPAKFAVFRDDVGSDSDAAQGSSPQPKGLSSSGRNAKAGSSSFAYYMGLKDVTSSLSNSSDRFMEWFESVKSSVIRSEDSRGKPEWVAAMRSHDNENGSEMSFEEMRTQHPKYKLNMAPSTSFDADFEEKIVTPDSPTIETKAAMKIVGEIWTTTSATDFDDDSSMDIDDRPRRILPTHTSDENGDARPMLGDPRTPSRRPLSAVPTGRSPLGERLFASPSKRRHIDTKP